MTRIYIGIDIGGTNTRFIALRGIEKQRARATALPTPRSRRGVERMVVENIRSMSVGGRLAGVGIGIAGSVDVQRKIVVAAEHLPFLNGWKPLAALRPAVGVPMRLENDARCFLLAEALWGAARGKRNIVGVAIGTGIGGGIMIDGAMYRGAHGSAGEVGDIFLEGRRTFEQSAAKRAWEQWGNRSQAIGRGVAGIVSTLDPELMVLGGGAVAAGKVDLRVVRHAVRRFAIEPAASKTRIVFGDLGDAAQAIGAALLFALPIRPVAYRAGIRGSSIFQSVNDTEITVPRGDEC